ncbi:hypothetical protein EIN_058370 [Entamoeba invadens IP1]|uniref:hypothetical protein n=1 Tax=Entamoeba invadens IP1 TaxID=370355 RepID=UPI0002C3DA32|nr:hypothetical protein EIN_058370 [Entamoeba invadens IP1]ELP93392.1 hypothetical protein EIN_058370 [Entamoeba invadens IP1]|eukprot:XP_004260163.1 hypothetical protein EIN_058370 [Entamoeba invadens IP1]
MKLEQVFVREIVKYLSKEEIQTIVLVSKKVCASVEQSRHIYGIDDFVFLFKHFPLLLSFSFRLSQIDTIPFTLVDKEVSLYIKPDNTPPSNDNKIINDILKTRKVVQLDVSYFDIVEPKEYQELENVSFNFTDDNQQNVYIQPFFYNNPFVVQQQKYQKFLKFVKFVENNEFQRLKLMKISIDFYSSTEIKNTSFDILKTVPEKIKIFINFGVVPSVKTISNLNIITRKNTYFYVKTFALFDDHIPKNVIIESPLIIGPYYFFSKNTYLKDYITSSKVTHIEMSYNNSLQINKQDDGIQLIDLSEFKSILSVKCPKSMSVYTKIIFPETVENILFETYDYVISNVFDTTWNFRVKCLVINSASFLRRFEFPNHLEMLSLSNIAFLESLDLEKNEELKELRLENIFRLSVLKLPPQVETLFLRTIGKYEKTLSIYGLQKNQKMKKCSFDDVKNVKAIELPCSVEKLYVSSCYEINIENLRCKWHLEKNEFCFEGYRKKEIPTWKPPWHQEENTDMDMYNAKQLLKDKIAQFKTIVENMKRVYSEIGKVDNLVGITFTSVGQLVVAKDSLEISSISNNILKNTDMFENTKVRIEIELIQPINEFIEQLQTLHERAEKCHRWRIDKDRYKDELENELKRTDNFYDIAEVNEKYKNANIKYKNLRDEIVSDVEIIDAYSKVALEHISGTFLDINVILAQHVNDSWNQVKGIFQYSPFRNIQLITSEEKSYAIKRKKSKKSKKNEKIDKHGKVKKRSKSFVDFEAERKRQNFTNFNFVKKTEKVEIEKIEKIENATIEKQEKVEKKRETLRKPNETIFFTIEEKHEGLERLQRRTMSFPTFAFENNKSKCAYNPSKECVDLTKELQAEEEMQEETPKVEYPITLEEQYYTKEKTQTEQTKQEGKEVLQ